MIPLLALRLFLPPGVITSLIRFRRFFRNPRTSDAPSVWGPVCEGCGSLWWQVQGVSLYDFGKGPKRLCRACAHKAAFRLIYPLLQGEEWFGSARVLLVR